MSILPKLGKAAAILIRLAVLLASCAVYIWFFFALLGAAGDSDFGAVGSYAWAVFSQIAPFAVGVWVAVTCVSFIQLFLGLLYLAVVLVVHYSSIAVTAHSIYGDWWPIIVLVELVVYFVPILWIKGRV